MRRMIFAVICVIGMMTSASPSKAQVSVGVGVNISSQPLWGPVGYDYVEYYYLPDLEMYYYVPAHEWVYLNGGNWVFSTYLPYRYRDYDLYNTYKVVINEPRPYRYFNTHRAMYAGYRGGPHHQAFIRYSNNPKYFGIAGHPHYRPGGYYHGGYRNGFWPHHYAHAYSRPAPHWSHYSAYPRSGIRGGFRGQPVHANNVHRESFGGGMRGGNNYHGGNNFHGGGGFQGGGSHGNGQHGGGHR